MKIKDIHIQGVGGITDLKINFHSQMNILCGPNGIGKTTVLECIAHCFTVGHTNILKRQVNSAAGIVQGTFKHDEEEFCVNLQPQEYEPNKPSQINGRHDKTQYLLSLKTTRTFAYTPLTSVSKDPEKPMHIVSEESKNGVNVHDIKNWFVNRYLYSAHPETLTAEQMENLQLAKECFSSLNKDYSFSKVNASTNEIIVSTPSGEIYYEYLSSGFKSCLAILFGIIKEIEYRFPSTSAKTFNGVVLIDELELHLHPEWQYHIANVLTNIFPRTQFIVTTHSPHVIQSADPGQILALEVQGGNVITRDLPVSIYGFKGWTLDEVLTDVMGMSDTRTEVFGKLIAAFNTAIENEDPISANEAYEQLNISLHPRSHIRKLLRLQLANIAIAQ